MAFGCTWICLPVRVSEHLSVQVVILEQVRTAVPGETISMSMQLITQFGMRGTGIDLKSGKISFLVLVFFPHSGRVVKSTLQIRKRKDLVRCGHLEVTSRVCMQILPSFSAT